MKYTIRPVDVAAFWYFTAQHDPARRKFWCGVRLILVGAAILLGGLIAAAQKDAPSAIAAFIVVTGLLFALGLMLRLRARDYLFPVRLFVPEEQAPSLYGAHTLEVDDSGLSLVFPHGSSKLGWPAITTLEQTDRHLFLFTAPNQAIVVPSDTLQGCSLTDLSIEVRKHVQASI